MFNEEKQLKKLKKLEKYPEEKQKKIVRKVLMSEEFYEYIFADKNFNTNAKREILSDIYDAFAKPVSLRWIAKGIRKGDISINRNNAVIIYSICDYALSLNKDRIEIIETDASAIDVDKSIKKKINKYTVLISDVIEELRSAIKDRAKEVSKKTGLDRDLCINILCKVPNKVFIKPHLIGRYMSSILKTIYQELSVTNDFDSNGVRWTPLFKFLFGVEGLPNVATFILLEGVNRIDEFKNSDGIVAVKDCWDSLTKFALDELENCDDNTRTQMMELYIKRISRSNNKSIRVDLMKLPSHFTKLIDTVTKYSEKITKALGE